MKKVTLIFMAIVSMAFKNAPKIGAGVGIIKSSYSYGQNVVAYSDFLSHKYHLLVTNPVGATTPSNAISVFIASKDTFYLPLANIKFSGMTSGTVAITPGSKMFSMDNNKILGATDFSLITVPYSQITGTPSIPGAYTLTIPGIYSVLTYTPYNSMNPAGYISSYTEADPLFNSKFASKNTADLPEGSSLYYTSSRFNTAFGGKNTGDLSEGTNLYYTPARFNTSFSGKTTTDLPEGFNLYFTAARARTTVSAGTGISYVSATGVIANSLPDQTVSIAATSTNITVTGTYPSFTVANAAPDQAVSLAAGNSNISIISSYPAFTLTPYTPTTFTATRAINSVTFQVSSTRAAWVYYTIKINCVATIGSSSSGTVALQYSTNNGSAWIDVGQMENSNVVTLAIVLNSSTTQTSMIAGIIPAGAIVRMNQTIAGTTTITYVRGQETY